MIPSGKSVNLFTASVAFSFTASVKALSSVSLSTVTPVGVAFGNTLTGTSTVSSPVGYLTVALTVKSVAPTLTLSVGTSLLMSASVTGVKSPPLSGVIASLTSAGLG